MSTDSYQWCRSGARERVVLVRGDSAWPCRLAVVRPPHHQRVLPWVRSRRLDGSDRLSPTATHRTAGSRIAVRRTTCSRAEPMWTTAASEQGWSPSVARLYGGYGRTHGQPSATGCIDGWLHKRRLQAGENATRDSTPAQQRVDEAARPSSANRPTGPSRRTFVGRPSRKQLVDHERVVQDGMSQRVRYCPSRPPQ